MARREGDGDVVIDHITNRREWLDRRRVKIGVFEVLGLVQEGECPVGVLWPPIAPEPAARRSSRLPMG